MNDSADAHDPRDPRSDPRGEETGARSHGQDARSGDDRAAGRDLTRIERTRGSHPGDQFVRFRPHPDFRRLRSGHLVPSEQSAGAHGGIGRTLSGVKRFLLGRPLTTAEERGERLGRLTGLPILASDNISSSAYATEEIVRVLVLAGVAALALTLPITLGICAVLAIVVLSYREVIRAYPGGGGSYVVAKDNLGPVAGLTAAAALLTDYVLTVSVSVAAGGVRGQLLPSRHAGPAGCFPMKRVSTKPGAVHRPPGAGLPRGRDGAAAPGRPDRRIRVRGSRMDGIPSGGTTMARTLTCDCGEVLTGQDDEELFRQGRQHIKEDHPNLVMSDGQIRDLITAKAKDA